MERIYYLLPADFCQQALMRHQIARDDALAAKAELLEQFGCVAVARNGPQIVALAYKERTELSGFTLPRLDPVHGLWTIRPKANTLRGKKAQQMMAECADLLEIWQWSLEHSLGVFGIVSDRTGFHYLVATPLHDGRVLLDAPAGKNRPCGPSVSRNFDDPVIPDCAVPIAPEAAQALLAAQVRASAEEAAALTAPGPSH